MVVLLAQPPSRSVHEMGATKSQGFYSKPKRKGGDVSVDLAKGLAVSAADSIGKFHETHYAMVRDFSEFEEGRSLVTTHDHVHYHVYGDYRLNLSELIGPNFDVVSVQAADLRTARGPELTGILDTIASEYHTVPTTISRMVQEGRGNAQYQPVPMLRFKVANYKDDVTRGTAIETDEVAGRRFLQVPRLHSHLVSEGHSSRANLGVDEEDTNGCDKLQGFIQAGSESGISCVWVVLVLTLNLDYPDGLTINCILEPKQHDSSFLVLVLFLFLLNVLMD